MTNPNNESPEFYVLHFVELGSPNKGWIERFHSVKQLVYRVREKYPEFNQIVKDSFVYGYKEPSAEWMESEVLMESKGNIALLIYIERGEHQHE